MTTLFHEIVDDPGTYTPEELYDRYISELVGVIEAFSVETVAETTAVDVEKAEKILSGDVEEITLEEAAAILSVADETPDAETIAALGRDELLLGMTNAVLDVEAVESGIKGELEAREIQSKVEGRFPMTLEEFALLHQFITSKEK